MTAAVRRPRIAAYRALITSLHRTYGSACWSLLYQTDVRCRQERMDSLKYELHLKHDRDVSMGIPSSFNTAKPWDQVWEAIIADGEYWRRNFEVPANFVKNGQGLSTVVDGDAPIQAPGHARSEPNPVKRKTPAPTNTGSQKLELCKDYNRGACSITADGHLCPKNNSRRHGCSICGKNGHGAHECRSAKPTGNPKGDKGQGKKNNGGKKNRGGGKQKYW